MDMTRRTTDVPDRDVRAPRADRRALSSWFPGTRTAAPTVWETTEPDVLVASRQGRVLGYVVVTEEGTFVSFDAEASPIARLDSLVEAKRTVDGSRAPRAAFEDRTIGGVVFVSAALVSGVTVAMLIIGALAASVR